MSYSYGNNSSPLMGKEEKKRDPKEEAEYQKMYSFLMSNENSKKKLELIVRVQEDKKKEFLNKQEEEFRAVIRSIYYKEFEEKERKEREEAEAAIKEAANYMLNEEERKKKAEIEAETEKMKKMFQMMQASMTSATNDNMTKSKEI